MSVKKLMESQPVNISDIIKNADEVRKRVLDVHEIDPADIAPNIFDYISTKNDIGLNLISNVDIGYAASQVGDKIAKRVPYINELESHVKLMEQSPNAAVILNGNLFTFVPKSSETGLLSPSTQVAYYYSLFKNLAKQGKIVALVRGEGEHRMAALHKIDAMEYLALALGVENKLCNEALINIGFTDENIGDVKAAIRTINWQNVARTPDYIVNAMHDRAKQKPGADVYVARTALNTYSVQMEKKVENGKIVEKPIFLVSGGPYKPFDGAKRAGAEYNSIRDAELSPNMFWTRINAQAADNQKGYNIQAFPIHYLAHHTLERDTDEHTAAINSYKNDTYEVILNYFISELDKSKQQSSATSSQSIKQTLEKNKVTQERNTAIRDYNKYKKGEIPAPEVGSITDSGSNVERMGVQLKQDADLSTVFFQENDNTDRARRVNQILSPEVAFKEMEITDGAFPDETTRMDSSTRMQQQKIDFDNVDEPDKEMAGKPHVVHKPDKEMER